jgi:galactose mutarotase-like enzyme
LRWASSDLLRCFPFPHVLEVETVVVDDTITVTTSVTAAFGVSVPVSFGWHPFLQLPDVPRSEWQLESAIDTCRRLDRHHLPTGRREVCGVPSGERSFHGLWEAGDEQTIRLRGGDHEISVVLQSGYPFVQLWSPEMGSLVAIEPMTAPVNALVDGRDLPLVPAGATREATFRVRCSLGS